MKNWLVLPILAAWSAGVFAQMCYPVGTPLTMLGRTVRESAQSSDGSPTEVSMLAMDPPLCVIDKRYSQDPQGRISVSRVQILGQMPPPGLAVSATGTLVTGNSPRYFIVPTAMWVVPPTVKVAPQ